VDFSQEASEIGFRIVVKKIETLPKRKELEQ
jgi:hypothetical protein